MRKSLLREEDNNMDLTSFMDVVFILLIFVMLAVSFRKEIRALPLELPKVGEGEDPKGEKMELVLLPEGQFQVNGKNMDSNSLENLFASGAMKGKEIRLFADEKTDYGLIVRTLEDLRKAKADSLELAVRK
ncbi:biopolymer transporter ExbD [Leptospira perolatii]|uniref:Biopolymer transporter ExbD n=1 Tax=Leptospira perolatii TaxID=2023191 RepID=A0A2M9ZPJ5_9LEPT|nr:biopolymer transporter ExbD [Leptospira perolatii]PJZ70642.1 biopolymer transporter ExbD [Leptospira perolatii]PJZ73853.1 biopolymer transporter ExbD [Leptospira perolatii]